MYVIRENNCVGQKIGIKDRPPPATAADIDRIRKDPNEKPVL
jgi:hypothetical protein